MENIELYGLAGKWYIGFLDQSWPVMSFVLGLVDGFNPCAMWTLFVLLGFLLTLKDRRKQWLIGGVFIASSALIYFAALVVYLYGFSAIAQSIATSAMSWIFTAVGIMAIVTGFLVFLKAQNSGIDCDIRDAQSKKTFHTKIESILKQEKLIFVLLGMMLLAFSVNALELVCSFAIPTIFTATIVSLELPEWQNILSIVIYDIAYILDDILVFTIAIKTLSLKVFSPKLVQTSNYIGGILLIILGFLLVFDSARIMSLFA